MLKQWRPDQPSFDQSPVFGYSFLRNMEVSHQQNLALFCGTFPIKIVQPIRVKLTKQLAVF